MVASHGRTDTDASERTFYRRLLDLGAQSEIEPLLDEALALIVDVTAATTAYLELYDEDSDHRYWRGHRCDAEDLEAIRTSISHGIIARSIADGRTIETPSAQGDERFADLGSVQRNAIGAVLCAPIGKPPIGVVYLQDRTRPGSFDDHDREHAELFARQLATVADRLLAMRPRKRSFDHTAEIRTRLHCAELIGRSRSLARVLQSAALVAPLDVDVLITGPSGTGKSALARAIAQSGPRAGKPFVDVNCAAIPEGLIESELFGAERGAHSTATRRIVGKVAAAEGGTLFLDEIGELSPPAQAKLLQLLQAREYNPLGSPTAMHADIRVISATNANLRAAVSRGKFREDLYYRVHVLPLEMPGLAERRDDIPELVEHFCMSTCRRHGFDLLTVSRRTATVCREAAWPGHVRQLEHAIEAGVIRAHGDKSATLEAHHVFPETEPRDNAPMTFHESTRRHQKRLVSEALERHDWNVAEAARELDLARSYVYNLIHEFKLERSGSN
ncbi:MAG TPA: sigma-54-dependent Fis family transcriptional regulator [Kofleriaceae bacterium]